jgi:hypothetical protein
VDYEDSTEEFFDRMNKIIKGMDGVGDIKNEIRYFPKPFRPLHDMVPTLKKVILENDIGLVIVDSAILACGGEPEKADVAARYFNALAALGATSLTIAHETKAENHAYPFGSVVWWNSPRNIWNAQGKSDPDETDDTNRGPIEVGLFHRKCNSGPRTRMIATKTTFGEDSVKVELSNEEVWDSSLPVTRRIVRLLQPQNGVKQMMGHKAIKDALGDVNENTLKDALKALKRSGKIILFGGQRGEYALNEPIQRTEPPK